MNVVKAKLSHKAFIIQSIQPFSFEYINTNIRIYKKEECLMIELIGRKKENGLLKVFFKLYDLLFLMLGAYPIRCSLSYNEKEIDTSKWVIRRQITLLNRRQLFVTLQRKISILKV